MQIINVDKGHKVDVIEKIKQYDFTLIQPSGYSTYGSVKTDKTMLEFLNNHVGGLIELVPNNILPDHYIFANEEGIILNLETNSVASKLCGQLLVGNVIFIRKTLVE